MVEALCIEKIRDKNGVIKEYTLRDTQGVVNRFEPHFLKNLILTNQINVVNLKLTSDGRLIDCTPSEKESEKEGVQVVEDIQSELAMLKLFWGSIPKLTSKILDFSQSRSGKAWVVSIPNGKLENMGKGNIKAKEQNINKLIFTIKADRKTLQKENSSMMIDYTVETFSILNEPGKEVYTGSGALVELMNLDLSKEKVVKTEFNKCFDTFINKSIDATEHKLYLKGRSASNINLRINIDNSKILKANDERDVISLVNNQDICPEILIFLYELVINLLFIFRLNHAQMMYLLGKSRILENYETRKLDAELRHKKLDKNSNDEILKSHGSAVKLTKQQKKETLQGIGYRSRISCIKDILDIKPQDIEQLN